MGNVRFTSRIREWTNETIDELDIGLLDMVTDIDREAKILAPKDKRNLVNSARIERVGKASYKLTFGGGSVPYAKRRHYENKKNPGSIGYLERPGDKISRNIKRYIGKI